MQTVWINLALAQNQSSTQITDTHPNVLTSKDLNIPATQSTTSSTQTQKDVTANTTENKDEETMCNIEKDPFFSGTKLNIFFLL